MKMKNIVFYERSMQNDVQGCVSFSVSNCIYVPERGVVFVKYRNEPVGVFSKGLMMEEAIKALNAFRRGENYAEHSKHIILTNITELPCEDAEIDKLVISEFKRQKFQMVVDSCLEEIIARMDKLKRVLSK